MTEKEILSQWPEIEGKLIYIFYGLKSQTAKVEQVRFISLTDIIGRDRYAKTPSGGTYRVRMIIAIKPKGMAYNTWIEDVVEPMKKSSAPRYHKTDGLINLMTNEKMHFGAEPIPSPPDTKKPAPEKPKAEPYIFRSHFPDLS